MMKPKLAKIRKQAARKMAIEAGGVEFHRLGVGGTRRHPLG